jgi:predicted transcriptional regulator
MLNLDQFMNIRFLQKQGHSVREIARLTGHARNTVRKLLRAKRAPVPAPRGRASKLDPYKPYLTERWQAHGLSAVRAVAIRNDGLSSVAAEAGALAGDYSDSWRWSVCAWVETLASL